MVDVNSQPVTEEKVQALIDASASKQQFNVADTSFHVHNGLDSSTINFTDTTNRTRYIWYRCLDASTAASAATVVGGYFRMPFSGTFVSAAAVVDSPGTTGTMVVNIKRGTTTSTVGIFGVSALTIASGAAGSNSQTIFFDNTFSISNFVQFDIVQTHTTPAHGLSIILKVIESST